MIVCRILGKDIHTGGFLRQRKVGFGKNRQDLSEKNSKKNIESIKRDGNSSWTVYLRDEDVPITLVIPSYVPDIAECHGQYPIDQVEEAEIFSQLMECFPQKEL